MNGDGEGVGKGDEEGIGEGEGVGEGVGEGGMILIVEVTVRERVAVLINPCVLFLFCLFGERRGRERRGRERREREREEGRENGDVHVKIRKEKN